MKRSSKINMSSVFSAVRHELSHSKNRRSHRLTRVQRLVLESKGAR